MMADIYKSDKIGKEIFIQEKVLVKNVVPNCQGVDFDHNLGTVSITEYPEPLGKCIEWRQCRLTVETVDAEWEVVQEEKTRRFRTVSGCDGDLKPAVIQLKLSELRSFRLSGDHKITLLQNDGITSCCFYFQNNAKLFVQFLKTVLQTTQCKRDKKLHLVSTEQQEVNDLNKSFAQLELFPETKSDVLWSFMHKFQNRPYETTMETFSKVTDALLSKPAEEDERGEPVNGSHSEDDHDGQNAEEYHVVVAEKAKLESRELPPRTLPLTERQWTNFIELSGQIPEYSYLKEMIFRGGVTPSIRKEVWMFLLEFYPWLSTREEREQIHKFKSAEYFRMKLQWKTMSKDQEERFSDFKERKSLIEKDVARTDRTMAYYAEDNNPHLEQLQDILMTYVMYNFDLGYVQGMSDLLSPLLILLENEVDTFWCFTKLIDRMSIKWIRIIRRYNWDTERADHFSWIRNFDVDQAGMKSQLFMLKSLLSVAEPELASYIIQQDCDNMFFCFRWLLVWFKREFAFHDIYVLWETLWAESRCPNYILLVCIAILATEKDTIMNNQYGFTEILKHVNELSCHIDLELTLRKAEGIYMQLSKSDIPRNCRHYLGLPVEDNGQPIDVDTSSSIEILPDPVEGEEVESPPRRQQRSTEECFEEALSMHFT